MANNAENAKVSVVREAESVLECARIPACSCCDADGNACPFDLFKVFADTTRIKILFALMGRELCVAHIAEMVNATQSAVSHQLRILKQAHLVKFQRDGKNVNYSLADDHVYTVLAQGITHVCE